MVERVEFQSCYEELESDSSQTVFLWLLRDLTEYHVSKNTFRCFCEITFLQKGRETVELIIYFDTEQDFIVWKQIFSSAIKQLRNPDQILKLSAKVSFLNEFSLYQ